MCCSFQVIFSSVSLLPSFAWSWAWELAEDVGHGRGSEMFVPFLWIHVTEPNLGLLTCAQQSQSPDTGLWWKWKLLSCVPMDCSPPGCSVYGILQARILEWVAIPFSRESSQPRDQTQVSCIAGGFFTIWATREAPRKCSLQGPSKENKAAKAQKAQLPLAFREAFLKPRWGRGVAGCVISSP